MEPGSEFSESSSPLDRHPQESLPASQHTIDLVQSEVMRLVAGGELEDDEGKNRFSRYYHTSDGMDVALVLIQDPDSHVILSMGIDVSMDGQESNPDSFYTSSFIFRDLDLDEPILHRHIGMDDVDGTPVTHESITKADTSIQADTPLDSDQLDDEFEQWGDEMLAPPTEIELQDLVTFLRSIQK